MNEEQIGRATYLLKLWRQLQGFGNKNYPFYIGVLDPSQQDRIMIPWSSAEPLLNHLRKETVDELNELGVTVPES